MGVHKPNSILTPGYPARTFLEAPIGQTPNDTNERFHLEWLASLTRPYLWTFERVGAV